MGNIDAQLLTATFILEFIFDWLLTDKNFFSRVYKSDSIVISTRTRIFNVNSSEDQDDLETAGEGELFSRHFIVIQLSLRSFS